MPLYEINPSGEMIPFRQRRGGAELYESEIEELVWKSLEEVVGEPLFPIRRQLSLPGGGKPDIVALDKSGRVVVIEIKRDVDRAQLAQSLEYAGWARRTNLDELASKYPDGADAFFRNWQAFTESDSPQILNLRPRLVLVARDFDDRTESALGFLIENGVPVLLVPIVLYEEGQGRKLVDVGSGTDPELLFAVDGTTPTARTRRAVMLGGRRVRVSDLVERNLLQPGDKLVWMQRTRGLEHHAEVTEAGAIRLSDGREVASPSRAALEAAGANVDGWEYWTVVRTGETLHGLRMRLVAGSDQPMEAESTAAAAEPMMQ